MRRTLPVVAACLLLCMAGCGGGDAADGDSESDGEPDQRATGTPDPPPQEDIDIDSDGIDVGGNGLSASTSVGEWQLPPTMFGAIDQFKWHVGNVAHANLSTVTFAETADLNLTWTITNSDGNVSYAVDDNGTTRAVTAYTPTDGDCSLIGTGMARVISGAVLGGEWTQLAGGITIQYTIQPASDTGCN